MFTTGNREKTARRAGGPVGAAPPAYRAAHILLTYRALTEIKAQRDNFQN